MVPGRPKKPTKAEIPMSEEPSAKVARTTSKELLLPIVLKHSGNLLACGQGELGQLGLGELVMERGHPALVAALKNVVDIRAGGMHSLCLTKNGDVFSFGCNDEGALGRDTTEEGSEFTPIKIELPVKCLKVSAGDSHSACLLEDGRVFAWGSFRDSHGNMGLTIEGNKRLPIEIIPGTKFVDISSGADHLIVLTTTGQIYTVGCAEQGQLGRVSSRSASGESRRGKNELLVPGLVPVKNRKPADAVWATTYCSFYREANSSNIFAFGLNNYSQLGVDDRTELVFGPKLTNFKNVLHIDGGQHHTLILTNDKKCYVIGRKDYGRLGLGSDVQDLTELALIKSLTDKKITDIACGESSSFALTANGEVYSWGMGSNKQLGTGVEDDEYEPVLLAGAQVKGKKVLKISSGGQHSLFIVEVAPETETIKPVKNATSSAKTVAPAIIGGAMDTNDAIPVNGNGKIDNGPIIEEAKKVVSTKDGAKRGRKRKN